MKNLLENIDRMKVLSGVVSKDIKVIKENSAGTVENPIRLGVINTVGELKKAISKLPNNMQLNALREKLVELEIADGYLFVLTEKDDVNVDPSAYTR